MYVMEGTRGWKVMWWNVRACYMPREFLGIHEILTGRTLFHDRELICNTHDSMLPWEKKMLDSNSFTLTFQSQSTFSASLIFSVWLMNPLRASYVLKNQLKTLWKTQTEFKLVTFRKMLWFNVSFPGVSYFIKHYFRIYNFVPATHSEQKRVRILSDKHRSVNRENCTRVNYVPITEMSSQFQSQEIRYI